MKVRNKNVKKSPKKELSLSLLLKNRLILLLYISMSVKLK